IPARLASLQDYPGCHKGYVTDLGREWLGALPEAERKQTELFACGPEPMLEAAAKLAHEFNVPCQLCLEEFMACAVGGCAGCVVPFKENDKVIAMKRVCVDGPIFNAQNIF
ncbi:MAG: dihydroorotate dehydrogenase electron transfer subunit, partial [Gammaproteobacteria bacterium]|nr:dihydroorotate dehydrogenase electron transfer subunit [Gammaproteobacteria bacterium]